MPPLSAMASSSPSTPLRVPGGGLREKRASSVSYRVTLRSLQSSTVTRPSLDNPPPLINQESTIITESTYSDDSSSSKSCSSSSSPPTSISSPPSNKKPGQTSPSRDAAIEEASSPPLTDPVCITAKIKEYIRLCRTEFLETDLRLAIEPSTIVESPLAELLRSVRYTTNIQVSSTGTQIFILRVKCMSETPLHNSIARAVASMDRAMARHPEYLTARESKNLNCCRTNAFLPVEIGLDKVHGNSTDLSKLRKAAADIKEPDVCIIPDGAVFPPVVFETAMDEGNPDLVSDRKQWFRKGDTEVVVETDIEEDKATLERRKRERRAARKARRLAAEAENRQWKDPSLGDASDTDSSVYGSISPEEYKEEHKTIDPDKYVGPVRVTMEVWRRDKNRVPRLSGSPVVIMTPDEEERARLASTKQFRPFLMKKDLFPSGYNGDESIVPTSPKSRWYFDLDEFRSAIKFGIRDLAHRRMRLSGLKKRSRERSRDDNDYTEPGPSRPRKKTRQ